MSTDRHKLVKEIFADALEKSDAAERAAWLARACGEDVELRQSVAALLRAYEKAGAFLEQPAAGPVRNADSPEPGQTSTLTAELTEKAGDKIGPYKLLQQIGEGGCGVVYMAEQEEPIRRRVALKVIKLGMDTKQVIARFEAERQALALMDHPNIAQVLDAGATDTGRPYFVMELVRGIRITDYCDQNNLPTEKRLDLFIQVCHAIQHAHQKGIIHRDIKPSNILVTLHDGMPVPKVIDFGIAKATGGQVLTDKTVFTAFEQFIGTPAYMSPEQAEMSDLDIDTRSDIYALGVLLYELLTSHTPFDQKQLVAAGLDEMRRIIREQEPARPSTCLSTLADPEQTTVAKRRSSEPPQLIHLLRGDLDWIVMKSLEKDRTRRYETANGLADDVLRHLSNEPVAARPPSRLYRFQKLVRRNKLAFAAGSAVVAALLIGLGLSTWLFFREQLAHGRAVAAEKIQRQLRQQAQAEAKKSEQVAQFLKDMLQGVGPSAALGRDTTMLKEILDKTAERVGKDLKDQPEVEAELRSTIGGVYDALGQYQKAEAMHRSALTLRKGLWGNMNTNVADSLDSLGWELFMQDTQNLTDGVEPLFQEALVIRTNLLGAEHVKVAASLYHLGLVRHWQARYSEAEPLLRQSLAMRRKLLGNDHVDVAESLTGLSGTLINLGKPDQAEAAAREALAIQARVLPDERSATDAGLTQLNLGLALRRQNKLVEAEPVVRQAVTLRRNLLGTEHRNVAEALFFLADVLSGEDKLAEAEAVARQALAISRKTVGERHSTTAFSLTSLGVALHKAGRLAEAESVFREALTIWRQLGDLDQGVGTLSAAWVCGMLAAVLQEQGKLSEVEALYRAEVETARKSPVSDSQALALGRLAGRLADWLRDRGRPAEAEPLYREGMTVCRQSLTNDFATRQWLAGGLVSILKNQGKLPEAEALYRETIEVGRRSNDTNDLPNMLADLGDLLRDRGKLAEAEPLYREGLDICRRVSPENFDRRQWLASSLAVVLRGQGKLAEAESFYREAVTNAAKVWPNDPARWQWQVNDLADVLQSQGKSAEAEKLVAEVLKPAAQAQPRGIGALRTRVNLSGRQGRWKDAATDLDKLLELDPSEAYDHLQLAAVLVETCDLGAYRAHCRKMLARFGGTNDAAILDKIAKACLLVPGAGGDLEAASQLAGKTVALGKDSAWLSFFQFGNGLAEYRRGQYASAVDSMRKVVGQPASAGNSLQAGERDAAAWAVLALAQHQLKQTDQARAALTKGLELAQTKLPQLGSDNLEQDWVDWLIAHILLREARELVEGQPAPAADKTMP